jgi:hypothetical protein
MMIAMVDIKFPLKADLATRIRLKKMAEIKPIKWVSVLIGSLTVVCGLSQIVISLIFLSFLWYNEPVRSFSKTLHLYSISLYKTCQELLKNLWSNYVRDK